jgi:hypothetical protein
MSPYVYISFSISGCPDFVHHLGLWLSSDLRLALSNGRNWVGASPTFHIVRILYNWYKFHVWHCKSNCVRIAQWVTLWTAEVLGPEGAGLFSVFRHMQISTVCIPQALVSSMVHFTHYGAEWDSVWFDFIDLFLLLACMEVNFLIDWMYDLQFPFKIIYVLYWRGWGPK